MRKLQKAKKFFLDGKIPQKEDQKDNHQPIFFIHIFGSKDCWETKINHFRKTFVI
jgi:hypothetical protein